MHSTLPVAPPSARSEAAPKLLFLVTEDWFFWSHRLPLARAARDAGFAVIVATRVRDHGERIRAEGFMLRPLGWAVILVVVLGSANSHPVPGLHGKALAVTLNKID